jgi:hypothetical protein
MAKRHEKALDAQVGAFKPFALSNALGDAIREAYFETNSFDDIRQDPTVRMIAHQLVFLLGFNANAANTWPDWYGGQACMERQLAAFSEAADIYKNYSIRECR